MDQCGGEYWIKGRFLLYKDASRLVLSVVGMDDNDRALILFRVLSTAANEFLTSVGTKEWCSVLLFLML